MITRLYVSIIYNHMISSVATYLKKKKTGLACSLPQCHYTNLTLKMHKSGLKQIISFQMLMKCYVFSKDTLEVLNFAPWIYAWYVLNFINYNERLFVNSEDWL